MKAVTYILRIILLVFLFPALLAAQPYSENYELISTRDGLSHNTIEALLQDSVGYLWIGTYNGLCIYDGKNINTYKGVFGESKSSWQFGVEVLFEDNKKNVWLGSKAGAISCFDRMQQQFIQYYTSVSTPFKRISCICQDSKSRIWVSDIGGNIGCIDSGKLKMYKPANKKIFFIAPAGSDSILFATVRGLFVFRLNAPEATPAVIYDAGENNIVHSAVNKNSLALLTLDETVIIDIKSLKVTGRINFVPTERNTVYHKIAPGANSQFYYTDGISIGRYEVSGTQADKFTISDHSQYDRNEIINCMIEDNSGLLWLGTNSGLYKIDRRKYHFRKYSINNLTRKLTHNYVRSLLACKNGSVWVGVKNGLINELVYDGNASSYVFRRSYPVCLPDQRIYQNYTANCLIELQNGKILAAGDVGLFILDKDKGCFSPYKYELVHNAPQLAWSLMEDKDKKIWVGTADLGLFVIDPDKNKIWNYTHVEGDENSLPDNAIWTIYRDSNGTIWLGTNNGLCQAITGDGQTGLSFRKKMLKDNISAVNVWDIKEDAKHNLWIGTTGHGIFQMEPDRNKVHQYDVLPTNVISSITPMDNGELWVSTVEGLYKFNPLAGTYTTFKENEGPISDDYNFKCAATANNGELFLGNKTGMISFFPNEVNVKRETNPALAITSVSVAGQDGLKNYYEDKKITIERSQNFFAVSFSLLDFTNPKRHKFRYMLEGFDHAWNLLPNNQSTAGYTNLRPGAYRLLIEGSSDGNNWSNKRLVVNITVKPAFWQVPLFWVFIFIVCVDMIMLIISYRTRQLIKKVNTQNEIDKKIAELELSALQSQMNPHFIFNTINAIQHFIIHNDEVAANDYLSKFAKLMRLFLESSKNKYIKVTTEIELQKLYLSLEKLRFEDKLDYEVSVAADDTLHRATIPSMLLQPFVENAIKHGIAPKNGGGLLKIDFSVATSENGKPALVCVIDDNGIGRKQSGLINARQKPGHISRGIELINERIKTYNFVDDQKIKLVITDKEYPETGTIVKITIPMRYAVLAK